MNRNRMGSDRSTPHARPQTALERIDEFLLRTREGLSAERINLIRRRIFGQLPEDQAENRPSNAERIRAMRQAYFADVDALQKTGTVKLPG